MENTVIPVVYLTRRNLLTLLSKLDRVKAGELSNCTLIKCDTMNEKYPQSWPQIAVKAVEAVEDGDYYIDREPGYVVPADDPDLRTA